MTDLVLAFVHGYSVTNLETYGELPLRLRNEGVARGVRIRTEDIFLGRYISFDDSVKLEDVAAALEFAVQQQIPKNTTFVCITHSTGGPVARTWWRDFYRRRNIKCPASHVIMLAPANHGSALAQLGKSKLSRVRSWLDGVQPGQGILDWLELGSNGSWNLNKDWIFDGEEQMKRTETFPFVITGQDIDRKLYDHVNSYTGEIGSDGAVRVASANIQSSYLRLIQKPGTQQLEAVEFKSAGATPLRVIRKRSHSGNDMGIMRSVKQELNDLNSSEIVNAIFECVAVSSQGDFSAVTEKFSRETATAQEDLKIETETNILRKKIYIHDRYCMVLFRVNDLEGNAITDFDLLLTAGETNDPDLLPTGFFADRQCNRVSLNTITYFINYDIMNGTGEVKDPGGEVIRKAVAGIDKLGIIVRARPDKGFVKFIPATIQASKEIFDQVLRPNVTTLIDIYVKRLVNEEVFRFEKIENEKVSRSFKEVKPGENSIS
jgi:hypothetical protein